MRVCSVHPVLRSHRGDNSKRREALDALEAALGNAVFRGVIQQLLAGEELGVRDQRPFVCACRSVCTWRQFRMYPVGSYALGWHSSK